MAAQSAGEAQAFPGRRAALRYLRALEIPFRTADRLEPRPQRRRPDEHPAVRSGRYLRKNLNIKWTKDRGKEPERPRTNPWFWDGDQFTGDRVNDFHLTIKQKQQAREKAKRAK